MKTLVINYAHPLNDESVECIKAFSFFGEDSANEVEEMRVNFQIDWNLDIVEQIYTYSGKLVEIIEQSDAEVYLIVMPSLSIAASLLTLFLYKNMQSGVLQPKKVGIVVMKKVDSIVQTKYIVSEICFI